MTNAVIELRGVTRSFGALRAVDSVSLDLRIGEIHALIGPNGAGKSTLVRLVTGELRADAGTIRLCGEDIGGHDAAARARLGLARSFQVASVIPGFTVLENVLLAVQGASGQTFRFLRPVSRDRHLTDPAEARLGEVGLADRATIRAGALSHGERRRLEVAMALALAPRAFLLDEPMAGMDPEGSKEMTALLSDLRRTAPILLIEHDMDAVFALADRISVLVYGRIVASGSVAEIRADPVVQSAYLGEEA